MGNDQVRFDPGGEGTGRLPHRRAIREIQKEHSQTRATSRPTSRSAASASRGKQKQYTINENLLGVTPSGGEIDAWETPARARARWCAAEHWPAEPLEVALRFERGEAVALDGTRDLPARRSSPSSTPCSRPVRRRPRDVHRRHHHRPEGPHRNEAPGLAALAAHRALEEAVLTKHQNRFKTGGSAASGWNWSTRASFHDPLKADLEAFPRVLAGAGQWRGGAAHQRRPRRCGRGARSPHILNSKGATYAQSADWGRKPKASSSCSA